MSAIYSDDQWKKVPGIRKWPCKKGKGQHKFALKCEVSRAYGLYPGPGSVTYKWKEFACEVCGKQKIEHLPAERVTK
jgi:hypothetical protein